jgi:ABC-type Co2+ transport system permease subunit
VEVVLVQHLFNQDGGWMVNGIDEFIINGILKPLLSSGNYEEYARIYNRAHRVYGR